MVRGSSTHTCATSVTMPARCNVNAHAHIHTPTPTLAHGGRIRGAIDAIDGIGAATAVVVVVRVRSIGQQLRAVVARATVSGAVVHTNACVCVCWVDAAAHIHTHTRSSGICKNCTVRSNSKHANA